MEKKNFMLPIKGKSLKCSLHLCSGNHLYLYAEDGRHFYLGSNPDMIGCKGPYVNVSHTYLDSLGCREEFFKIFGGCLIIQGTLNFNCGSECGVYLLTPAIFQFIIDER